MSNTDNSTVHLEEIENRSAVVDLSNQDITELKFSKTGTNPELLLLSGNPRLDVNKVIESVMETSIYRKTDSWYYSCDVLGIDRLHGPNAVCIDVRGSLLDLSKCDVPGRITVILRTDNYGYVKITSGKFTSFTDLTNLYKHFINRPWAEKFATITDEIRATEAQSAKEEEERATRKRFRDNLTEHNYGDRGTLASCLRSNYELSKMVIPEHVQVALLASEDAEKNLQEIKESLIKSTV